jgi:hypothetical protein
MACCGAKSKAGGDLVMSNEFKKKIITIKNNLAGFWRSGTISHYI